MAPFLENGDTDYRTENIDESDSDTSALVPMGRLLLDSSGKQDAAESGILPRITPEWLPASVSASVALATSAPTTFSAETLAWALQSPIPSQLVELYLKKFDASQTLSQINSSLYGCPLLFYAVERNHADLVRLCVDYGADPDIRTFTSMPVLPFLVLNAKRKAINASEVAKVLLSRGASPEQIPIEMWIDYMADPESADYFSSPVWKSSDFWWCSSGTTYKIVASGLNITLRYLLRKASLLDKPRPRTKQFTTTFGMSGLLEAPYHLIGQERATQTIISRVTSHVLLHQTDSFPLTMVFAGPSGHGKTEMARIMGQLLGVESIVIDCTEMKHETDLFGPKFPYQGWSDSSPLNLFLARENSKRSVVFLDEFEKTNDAVRNALLLPFESGTYRDRRNGNLLDCSNTIWTCATNLVDSIIDVFFTKHMDGKSLEAQKYAPFRDLDHHMRASFTDKLGAPLTGRLAIMVPFFPFQTGEQAIITHNEILRLAEKVRAPIDTKKLHFIGHLHLTVKDDGKVCKHISEHGYHRVMGARSIACFVRQHVAVELANVYQEDAKLVTDAINEGPLLKYCISLTPAGKDASALIVYRDGTTSVDK